MCLRLTRCEAAGGILSALIVLVLVGCRTASVPSGAPRPFDVGLEVLDRDGGHVQGIAAAPDALYVAQQTRLAKVDWRGRLLKARAVPKHMGDLCWHGGFLYTALARDGKGFIQVYDPELNLVREKQLDRGVDGITILDGVLYLGMGARDQPSAKPHRVNLLGRFDANTLEEVAPRAAFDYGHETKFGFQNITTDGKRLYGSFYAVKGAPQVAVFDRDLRVTGTHRFKANQGLDALPSELSGGRKLFIRATTRLGADRKIAACAFDFWSPGEETDR